MEPASFRDEALLVGRSDNDSDAESIDTNTPQNISDSGNESLSKKPGSTFASVPATMSERRDLLEVSIRGCFLATNSSPMFRGAG